MAISLKKFTVFLSILLLFISDQWIYLFVCLSVVAYSFLWLLLLFRSGNLHPERYSVTMY